MKTYDIKDRAEASSEGEYVLGSKDTGSHACYMIYGYLTPRESGRLICPGKGHEEIVLALKGDLHISGHMEGLLKEGSCFHITEDNKCFLENKGTDEALYIISGGHSGGGH